ncbi:MAG: MarR family transcriptional regulator [Thaumarchaeota archaeon]|nr:MarR family transcriptional regulator [Nitrososphaerota archaeon]
MEDSNLAKILEILNKNKNPITQKQIVVETKVSKATVSEILKKLVAEKDVERIQSPYDQLKYKLSLDSNRNNLFFSEPDYDSYTDIRKIILKITTQKRIDWFENVVFNKRNTKFDYPYRRLFTKRAQEIYSEFKKKSPRLAEKLRTEMIDELKEEYRKY